MTNVALDLAIEYIQNTDKHIFLTGKAGTGKTTFLHHIKRSCPKRFIITAPTGVAAMNAGGVTLHSFFQIPFSPYVPGQTLPNLRIQRNKIDIIKSLHLLVIDEISMVRADVLDCIDAVLRRYRTEDKPFGGVQLLMMGDLHQLPPIVNKNEWAILNRYYQSQYFFSSQALSQSGMISIELQTIYRQKDQRFIKILNHIRDNQLSEELLTELNRRYIPDFAPDHLEECITLTTHTRAADQINYDNLHALMGPAHTLKAEVTDHFPDANYPTDRELVLKVDAQVMFVRNDTSSEKRYFNGKIGKVVAIESDLIVVQCPGESTPIQVEPVTWRNISFSLDADKKIIEHELGTFTQYPLRLAWAITIHKSQGLSFDHAIIDAQSAFTHGQVYVALSRCTSLQGLVLSTPIASSAIKIDPVIVDYTRKMRQCVPSEQQLNLDKDKYYRNLVLQCFSFSSIAAPLKKLRRFLAENASNIPVASVESFHKIDSSFAADIMTVAEKFQRQLATLLTQTEHPSQNTTLAERIDKARSYFTMKLQQGILEWMNQFDVDLDNKALKSQLEKINASLYRNLQIKLAALNSCARGFSVPAYLTAIANANITPLAIQSRSRSKAIPNSAGPNDELLQSLKAWRNQQADKENVAPYRILHQRVLASVASDLPQSTRALFEITGIGPKTVAKYADDLLALVNQYVGNAEHNTEVPSKDSVAPLSEKSVTRPTSS